MLVNMTSIFYSTIYSASLIVVCSPDHWQEGVSSWFILSIYILYLIVVYLWLVGIEENWSYVIITLTSTNSISVLLIDALGMQLVKHNVSWILFNGVRFLREIFVLGIRCSMRNCAYRKRHSRNRTSLINTVDCFLILVFMIPKYVYHVLSSIFIILEYVCSPSVILRIMLGTFITVRLSWFSHSVTCNEGYSFYWL
jgi:hypothetical protein